MVNHDLQESAMAEQTQGQFGYQMVQLLKNEPLGTGSYGAVYKTMCDDLPCAGKIIHPTLFQSNDPGAMTIMRRFQQECSFLSAIRHPNIVQYLGSYQDPETQLPVLLMELMDGSLTKFLEQSQEPILYHTQVDLCHDIALALAYLHSNSIIHRDLSSNNVLLIGAGNKAKVTDFGMAKLFDVNRSTITHLTMCPGTLAYMSPEALDDPPVYTKKLDSFSFGVLDIQIITQLFPDPGPRTKKVHDPRSPTGRMEMPVLETERRKSHIDLIDPTHPLLAIAINCLSYNEEDRSSAQELCHRLVALKEAPQYGDSVQQAQERSRPVQNTTADREDREEQIRELQREKEQLLKQREERDEQIQDLKQQLKVRFGQIGDKDAAIAVGKRQIWELQQQKEQLQLEKDEQIEDLQQQLQDSDSVIREKDAVIAARQQKIQHITQEKDHVLEARERKLRELNQQLKASEQVAAQFQQNLLLREKMIQDLREENQRLQQKLQEKDNIAKQSTVMQKGKLRLSWKMCKPAPCALSSGSATVCGSMAYFNPCGSNEVLLYNSDTGEWSPLPACPTKRFTLTVVNRLVTAIGGWLSGNYTNTLFSLMKESGRRKWVEHFPPMPTRRAFTAVVCIGKVLVVAGGQGRGLTPLATLATVEVMDINTQKWSTASNLPRSLSHDSAVVCGDSIYLVSGQKNTKSVFTCSLSELLQSQTSHPVWHTIANLPITCSTCVTLNRQLLAVGGRGSDNEDTDNIYAYNTTTNSWEVISHMTTPRRNCLVAVVPGNKLMVVGGETGLSVKDKVEIATVQ